MRVLCIAVPVSLAACAPAPDTVNWLFCGLCILGALCIVGVFVVDVRHAKRATEHMERTEAFQDFMRRTFGRGARIDGERLGQKP